MWRKIVAGDFEDAEKAYNNGDYKKAASLYQKACNGGNAVGCSNLGNMYHDGEGVRQDYKKAASLYQKACDGGDATGCTALGAMYANGRGVRQNYSTAKKFYGKACGMGDQDGCDHYEELIGGR